MLLRSVRLIFRLMAMFVLLCFAMPAEAAHSGDNHRENTLTPAMEKALRLSVDDYTYELLSMRGILEGQLGDLYRTLKPVVEAGGKPNILVTYMMGFPDGSVAEIELMSFAEIEMFINAVKKRYAAFNMVLVRREPNTIKGGTYRVSASSSCADAWLSEKNATITRDGSFFAVSLEDHTFVGTVVGGRVMVICPYGSTLPLVGNWQTGTLNLRDTGDCEVALSPG